MTRKGEDSGLIDLDALMREAHASAPDLAIAAAPSTPAIEASAPPEPPPSPPPPSPPPPKLPNDSLEAVTTEPATPRRVEPPRAPATPRVRRTRRSPVLGGVAVLLAVLTVTGAILTWRKDRGGVATTAAPAVTTGEIPAASASAAPAEQRATGTRAEELPPAVAPAASSSGRAAHARSSTSTSTSTSTKGSATLEAQLLEAQSAPDRADLGEAMRGAVGEKGPTVETTQPGTRTAAQLHPSPGAIVGAIGSVLPTARACLGPEDAVRTGVVVFRSDGAVARVEIGGGASQDVCVRQALSKAKVAPFVEESFSTRVTVRP